MSAEARAVAGIGDGLLRLSVGIEAAEDLVADLLDALDRAHRATVETTAAPTGSAARTAPAERAAHRAAADSVAGTDDTGGIGRSSVPERHAHPAVLVEAR